jgi:hypothetical protein
VKLKRRRWLQRRPAEGHFLDDEWKLEAGGAASMRGALGFYRQQLHADGGAAAARDAQVKRGVLLGYFETAAHALAAMMLAAADVVGRHVLGRPVPGTVEQVQYAMAVVVFAGLPW